MPADPAFQRPPEPAGPVREPKTGHRCRCEDCFLSVYVLDAARPTVCPFCQHRMKQESFPLRPPAENKAEHNFEERLQRLYHPPPRVSMLLMAAGAILLLTMVIYLQLINIEHYWYSPLVNIFSLVVGIFILTRFLFAAFYSPPPSVGFEPPVTVSIPCYNEEKSIAQTIAQVFAQDYPHWKTEVIVVNDGSRDNTLEEMLKAQAAFPLLVIVDFERNRGLVYGMAAATLMAHSDFIVFVDSDTFLMPNAVRKVIQGFVDPTVGGISGHTDVENSKVNLLTRMQDVRYYFSYTIMKAAESAFGMVSCLPGCFSAYRRSCVLHVLNDWIHSTCFGKIGNYGDDRSLTNFVLKDYRILYDSEAVATTLAPENWRQYVRQQARWMRSYAREVFRASKFMWRKHPVPALSWYVMMWMPIVEPLIILQALVIGPLLMGTVTMPYVVGVMAITLIWSMEHLRRTGRTDWWAGFFFTFSYALFFSWQIYYALATLRRAAWGTRGTGTGTATGGGVP